MTAEEVGKLVEDAAKALGEHFEAVQILASNSDHEGTRSIMLGAGNFFARLAMAQEFIDKDSNQMLGSKIAEAIKGGDEE